jgi:uncharacterized protein YndB with AHSA1/START domain
MRFSSSTLAVSVLFAVVAVPGKGADIELPGIVVTGHATKPPDIVSRDRAERSPDIHWPPNLSLRWSEMFAHNVIEINAPAATVWNHLVQAELWPQWLPKVGKVKVNGDSHILEKNTNFTWSGFDLPLENIRFETVTRVESRVVEYVPENRLSWVTYAPSTVFGPLYDSYHTWLLTPTGAKKCRVIFEDVATGLAALHARGNYPEILHLSHQRWLEGLKRTSESGNSKGLAPVSHF